MLSFHAQLNLTGLWLKRKNKGSKGLFKCRWRATLNPSKAKCNQSKGHNHTVVCISYSWTLFAILSLWYYASTRTVCLGYWIWLEIRIYKNSSLSRYFLINFVVAANTFYAKLHAILKLIKKCHFIWQAAQTMHRVLFARLPQQSRVLTAAAAVRPHLELLQSKTTEQTRPCIEHTIIVF